MYLPAFFGKVIYFFGYPVFRLLIRNTRRAYVAVIVNDSVLLTKNWLGMQKKWRLPGGGVHTGEAPIDAAVRELAEEVGITVATSQLQALNKDAIKASFAYMYDVFALHLTTQPVLAPDKKEILAAEFVHKQTVKSVAIGEETASALRLIGWRE